MVNGAQTHPDDLELLDLVEGDLPQARATEIAAHVERCTRCERAVEELQAGRAATHTAARLELSAQARDRITEAIGREREHPRRSWLERLRPAAVVVAAVLVLGSFVGLVAYNARDQGGDQGEAAGEGAGQTAAEDSSGGGEEAAPEPPAEEPVVASVGGTPRTVAQALRRDGFDARVAGSRVIVRGASAEAVQESLADRGAGPVEVFVRP
jgi:hypothetical protein